MSQFTFQLEIEGILIRTKSSSASVLGFIKRSVDKKYRYRLKMDIEDFL